MAGYNIPYSRLVDVQHDRKRSIAALRRSTTLFFILSLIAAVVAVGMIATLVVYLYFSSQFSGTDSSLPPTAPSGFAETTTNTEDFAHILQRLTILEREVKTLKKRCTRHDKGHTSTEAPDNEHLQPESTTKDRPINQQTTQQSVTRILHQLMSTTSSIQSEYHLKSEEESLKSTPSSIQESTISLHQSSSTSTESAAVRTSPNLEGPAPSLDQQTSSIMKAGVLGEDHRRLARSRHNRKPTRRSREDVALSTDEPPQSEHRDRGDRKGERRGNSGTRDRSSKRRDRDEMSSCNPCNAPTTFGSAAHFEGQRNGNVLITHEDGVINEPRVWRYASWMTQPDKDKFQLSLAQEVTVAEGGVYYIYSQIMFYDTNYAVGQSICVNNRPLFTCTKSNISAEAKQSTCSLGGLARLSAGDRLSIQLSVPNVRIALYADTSFFGLFKIADLAP